MHLILKINEYLDILIFIISDIVETFISFELTQNLTYVICVSLSKHSFD